MNARQNFYSSVFETINSYKQKSSENYNGMFLSQTMLGVGVFAATLLVAVFTNFSSILPEFSPIKVTPPNLALFNSSVTTPQQAAASEGMTSNSFRIAPYADTYINQSTPAVVYGKAVALQLSADPQSYIVYSFHIPPMKHMRSATLEIPKTGSSNGTYEVYIVLGNSVDEYATNFSNFSRVTSEKIRSGIPLEAAASLDIFPYVEQNSTLTLMLRTNSGRATYLSREAGTSQLPIIELQ